MNPKSTVTNGVEPQVHDQSTYVNWGCRCETCTAANTEWQRGARDRREAALKADPSLAAHGSASTYENWRCRCAPCTHAHTLAARDKRARGAS